MIRPGHALLLFVHACTAFAQYPDMRRVELRAGDQRPHINCLAQGPHGLLWAGSDIGVIRTDGLRHDLVVRSEPATVTAMASGAQAVYAALSNGVVIRMRGLRVDTVFADTLLARSPVHRMLELNGDLLLGTYGAGCWWWTGRGGLSRIRMRIDADHGMPDDHVNDLQALGDGTVAVATDQGIAMIDSTHVLRVLDESTGIPDNLILSLTLDGEGRLWAGSDQRGAFPVATGGTGVGTVPDAALLGEGQARSLAYSKGMIWMATADRGVVVNDLRGARYHPPASEGTVRAVAVCAAKDGAVWWCDGTDVLRRCDPDVLVMPEHEGFDLRNASALCSDAIGNIWFAIDQRVLRHECTFGDADSLMILQLPVGGATITALHVDDAGTLWAGTMGGGVFAYRPDGSTQRWTEHDGLVNDNVLAIAHDAHGVVLGTLAGIGRIDRAGTPSIPAAGTPAFIYDAVLDRRGRACYATDGDGVLRLEPDGRLRSITDPLRTLRTFYSLTIDERGSIWACGPGTGFCVLGDTMLTSYSAGVPPLDAEVFALESHQGHVLAFGERGVAVFDPVSRRSFDIGPDLGLAGLQMPLNASCTDTTGAVWIACNRGLVRLRPGAEVLDPSVPVVITDLMWGDVALPVKDGLELRYDQNFLTFHFAALRYGSPEGLRFQVRLVGFDTGIKETRDREASWSRLPPGEYELQVRASVGNASPSNGWTSLHVKVLAPWYRRGWAVVLWIALGAGFLLAALRLRDARLRERDRMEKEKVRFQLDALRSQVNPHFLFNSFNTLIELIEEDRGKAVDHVQQLSDFFRDILQVREKELITLGEEIALMRNYFALEERRFGDRIRLVERIDHALLSHSLPPLTLQLLVENAIKHNTATTAQPLIVEVTAENGVVRVRNPLRPRTTSSRSTGFGLDSIRQRYAALTAGPVEVGQEGGFFEVRIPLVAPEP